MTGYVLERAGQHGGWQVWALLRQRLDTRGIAGLGVVTARREPLAIMLRRDGETRAFALTAELADPESLADRIRRAR
jgi:hypothetical protein